MFSKDLELSIAALFDKAHEANIQYITVEHLLLMIMSDFDVKEFFKSKGISIDSLKDDLNNHNNVSIYSEHALILISNGKASQKDILNFANNIREVVMKTFNISLDIEPTVIN